MKKWTTKEIKILKKKYSLLSKKELMVLLPNRTWGAIRHRSVQLQLTWPTAEQRFWKYVNKKSNNKCWNWIGTCIKNGYGQIGIKDKMIKAHRFSWILHFGGIPEDLCVLHKCNNPRCTNPNHLELGDQKKNMQYKTECNRQARGEKNGKSKLTGEEVKEIKESGLTKKELSKRYNIHRTTIGDILNNKTWRHII